MESGKSHETAEEAARLAAARGLLRDAMGSVRNLAQVLHSVRVGPRPIESVLPDVHDSCASLEAHSRTLLEAVALRLPDRSAADHLLAWMAPRARELEQELGRARGKPVNAKARLALEQVVTRLGRELDAGRSLVDLLDDAVGGSRVQLDLRDLLRNAGASRDEGELVSVHVAADLEGETLVHPRVSSLILGIGARLVAERGASPRVRLAREATALALVIEGGAEGGDLVSLPTLPIVEPTLACASAAAQASATQLTWDESVPRFSLSFTG